MVLLRSPTRLPSEPAACCLAAVRYARHSEYMLANFASKITSNGNFALTDRDRAAKNGLLRSMGSLLQRKRDVSSAPERVGSTAKILSGGPATSRRGFGTSSTRLYF
jgi:hypothetical protein